MVTVAYNAYCAISMEGDDDTCDGKTAGSRSWEVEATVNSLVGTLFHVIITRMGTDLIFLSRLGSTICFTNFGSHDPIVLYWNPWYTEPCYKGSLLYYFFEDRIDLFLSLRMGTQVSKSFKLSAALKEWTSVMTNPPLTVYIVPYSPHPRLCQPPALYRSGCCSSWSVPSPTKMNSINSNSKSLFHHQLLILVPMGGRAILTTSCKVYKPQDWMVRCLRYCFVIWLQRGCNAFELIGP